MERNIQISFCGVSGMLKKEQTQYVQLIKVEDYPFSQDFNGNATNFTIEKQLEYLDRLTRFNEEEYGACEQILVTDEECDSVLRDIQMNVPNAYREREYFQGVDAALEVEKERRNCVLYTKKTAIKGNTIIFQDGDNYPVPCAKLQAEQGILYAQFQIDMGKEFETALSGGVWTMTSGRVLEFRQGIKEILKVQFYCDGSCCARVGEPDEWHHSNILLGKVDYKKPFSISVQFDKGVVYIGGFGDSKGIKLLSDLLPDVVFMGGGMCLVNTWSITPIRLKTSDGKEWNPFERIVKGETQCQSLGKVNLPYVVGTEKEQDKCLIVKKRICYKKDGKRNYLYCSTIDPDGEIYVNDVKVADNSDMMSGEWDITDYLREGENEIVVRANPRAPEILYSWHKHQDPYNGWFIGSIYLEKRSSVYIKDVQVQTLCAKDCISGKFILSLCSVATDKMTAKYFVRDDEGERLLGEKVFIGQQTEFPFLFEGKNWSPQAPHLYDVIVRLYQDENQIDEYVDRTGFRTIEQKNGEFYLNGEKNVLKGALLMQFLPPYEEIPLNHVCPSDRRIVWQALLAKKMGCNTVRMHQLGYGTNDERHARVFDALGIQVIWTTRLIDSVANICWTGTWQQKIYYQQQIKERFNHPCIIMWEGGNELCLTRRDIDCIYQGFVQGVKQVDTTRLICPISHMYYANDAYDKGCEYYQDNGSQDEYFRNVYACKEWLDSLVVRSAHTYDWMLGYGKDWEKFRLQDWSAQKALLESKERAYMISEYAIIGRQNPKHIPTEKQSYELKDESELGYHFTECDWKLSQAYQALAARYTTKYMLAKGVDGLLWCCLSGGANDGTYLKPPIDFYGYPKQAFYALQECFQDTVCFDDGCDVVWGKQHSIHPILLSYRQENPKRVKISVFDDSKRLVAEKTYENLCVVAGINRLPEWNVSLKENSYYIIKYIVECKE